MKYFFLLILFSCASYTDPEQERITYYRCDQGKEIAVKYADDYESVVIKLGKDRQVLLHHFVTASGVGYHAENLLWLTKGEMAILIEKREDGQETYLFKDCQSQKTKLQY